MELILKYFPDLDRVQKEKFLMMDNIYREWNSKVNVISRKDIDFFYKRHVLHSLGIAKVIQFRAGTNILDVGTGGGFPGIPLKVVLPSLSVTLCDASRKKISFLNHIIRKLHLTGIHAVHCRVKEDSGGRSGKNTGMQSVLGEKFDLIVSRAFSDLGTFINLAIPLLAPNGCLIAMKGRGVYTELEAVMNGPGPVPDGSGVYLERNISGSNSRLNSRCPPLASAERTLDMRSRTESLSRLTL